mgnify:CR=1 FL=1
MNSPPGLRSCRALILRSGEQGHTEITGRCEVHRTGVTGEEVRAAARRRSEEGGELAQAALIYPVGDASCVSGETSSELCFVRPREEEGREPSLSGDQCELSVALFGPRARIVWSREVNEQEGMVARDVLIEGCSCSEQLS